ncbi:hypothetical protein H5S40_04465 [Limosilactobacillus sp. RRLNB_1_1]|uniref:Uncharacterized protein n=1 Tax=Limosilactobacillus albertensis TaxID=2759752 RepID=A0A7W3TRS7_9LACO|nr:hypothetical protein [Limosilactobacillus albertensis]MBB1069406.1 hypothetical protein [Limosilactobacillus albertensis]MCD7117932.1 hypothetical protein [Limosilactobacillus albertensis]MCD7127814.1 hypothetical protein [Limosilactobacillus albertensis]
MYNILLNTIIKILNFKRVGNLINMLYHSSTVDSINDILVHGFQKVISWPGNINFLYVNRKTNYLGNFGIGTYAFLDNYKIAEIFMEDELKDSHNKEFKTIQFDFVQYPLELTL